MTYSNSLSRRWLLLLVLGCSSVLAGEAPKPAFLQNTKGKVVLVDFWASWCVPCRKSFPWMNSLQRKYADKGLQIIAINVDMERKDAEAFLKAVPAEFQIEYDSKGTVATQFNVAAMPTSFLIDRNGQVVQQHAGFREAQMAAREQEIQKLLEVKTP